MKARIAIIADFADLKLVAELIRQYWPTTVKAADMICLCEPVWLRFSAVVY
jgi:hypothetical protein